MLTENTRGFVYEAYDVAYVQEKWLPVWDQIAPFKPGRSDDIYARKWSVGAVSRKSFFTRA